MRIFLDTNILLDYLQQDRSSHKASALIIDSTESRQLEMVITGLRLVNLHYTLARTGYSRKMIRNFIGETLSACEVASTDMPQLQAAVTGGWDDFEDAVQYQAALFAGRIQAIITNDRKGFKGSRIPVFTPDAFVAEHL